MRENPLPDELLQKQLSKNPFFTPREVNRAYQNWANLLQESTLQKWIAPYQLITSHFKTEILVIAAGNIPLAGFHDFLCVLIAGFRFTGQLSSPDNLLLPYLASKLIELESEFQNHIGFGAATPSNPAALVASGSSNTARYHLQNYGHLPAIIRKTRITPAVLDGTESPEELSGLAGDILHYYGLGCRSVSSILMPSGYDSSKLIKTIRNYTDFEIIPPLQDNLRYQKARLQLLKIPFIDAGAILLVDNPFLNSPIATINALYYNSLNELNYWLSDNIDEIQCVVGHAPTSFKPVLFGSVQQPALWDYADGVDTLEFLISLS